MPIELHHRTNEGERPALLRHALQLRSAYLDRAENNWTLDTDDPDADHEPEAGTGELPFTVYTEAWQGTVDYIFYTVRGLIPLALLSPPDVKKLKDDDRRLPAEVEDAREQKPMQHDDECKLTITSLEGRMDLELDNVRYSPNLRSICAGVSSSLYRCAPIFAFT